MTNNLKIMIGTPTLSQEVTVTYLKSVFSLQKFAFEQNIDLSIYTLSAAQIDRARSIIASIFFEQKSLTHLLFIDADMGFHPELIRDMIAFDKPIVATIYPRRSLDIVAINSVKSNGSADHIHYVANAYVAPAFHPNEQGQLVVKGGKFAQVDAAGTGIMLIKRMVFETMALLPGMLVPEYVFPTPDRPKALLNCFQQISDDHGVHMSEDISFCRRWVQDCGGEIWASVAHEITHTGPTTFKGKYIEKLKANGAT